MGKNFGFDSGKTVKDIKRNSLVDINGFVLENYVTPANMHDKEGAKRVLEGIKFRMPRLRKIFGDSGCVVNAWKDPKFKKAVEATGRMNLIMTNVTTDVCLVSLAISAWRDGYQVQTVMN